MFTGQFVFLGSDRNFLVVSTASLPSTAHLRGDCLHLLSIFWSDSCRQHKVSPQSSFPNTEQDQFVLPLFCGHMFHVSPPLPLIMPLITSNLPNYHDHSRLMGRGPLTTLADGAVHSCKSSLLKLSLIWSSSTTGSVSLPQTLSLDSRTSLLREA